MGEMGTSDCSWKKMVIAKSDNQWTSSIKNEKNDSISSKSTASFSLDYDTDQFGNVKHEEIEVNIDPMYQNIHNVVDMTDSLSHDDPLLIEEGPRHRRRKSSGSSKHETSEERTARLAKMSAYAAQRLANETPEQRAVRLKRMSDYAAKRLAQETGEQRAKRLARMSAYAARRLASESPEQRKARLARMSAYAARRHASKKLGSSTATHDQITIIKPDQS